MKGQQQVFASVMMTGLFIGLIVFTYLWGVPLIKKNRDVLYMERAESISQISAYYLSNIPAGGKSTIELNIPAVAIFSPATADDLKPFHGRMTLQIETITSKYEPGSRIYLTDDTLDLKTRPVEDISPAVVFAESEKQGNKYKTTFTITTRPVIANNTCFFINMTGPSFVVGQGHYISFEYVNTMDSPDENYPDYCKGRAVKVINVKVSAEKI